MTFYKTDAEYREQLEQLVVKKIRCLSFDEWLLLDILNKCKVTHCSLCGSPVRHYIESECSGHGEFPRFLKISCQNEKCQFTLRDCISYGKDWRDVERDFINHCLYIKERIVSQHNL